MRDEQGNRLTTGPVHARDSKALEMPLLTTLPTGRYRVKYRVLSVDGHVLDASTAPACHPNTARSATKNYGASGWQSSNFKAGVENMTID